MRNRIEICGNIASGKTTLLNQINKELGVTAVYEDFKSNPFWEDFYTSPGEFVFETEITFTLQHYHAIKTQLKREIFACDFSMFLDLAYAKIGLSDNKLEIYDKLFNELLLEINPPKFLIVLNCNTKDVLKRIVKRGRKEEKEIDGYFISSLDRSIDRVTSNNLDVNIININSSRYNYLENKEDLNYVINKVMKSINND